MASINIFWKASVFEPEEQTSSEPQNVRTGVLTTDHEAAMEDMPVIVEDENDRVYTPADLPEDTVVYVEGAPGRLPRIAQLAREAGYQIEHA